MKFCTHIYLDNFYRTLLNFKVIGQRSRWGAEIAGLDICGRVCSLSQIWNILRTPRSQWSCAWQSLQDRIFGLSALSALCVTMMILDILSVLDVRNVNYMITFFIYLPADPQHLGPITSHIMPVRIGRPAMSTPAKSVLQCPVLQFQSPRQGHMGFGMFFYVRDAAAIYPRTLTVMTE